MSVKLRDICTFQSGGTPSKKEKRYFNGTIPWVTTVALNNGMITGKDANELITEDAIRESAAKIVPANSIMVGTRVGVGKVAINLEKMSTSQDIVSLIGINENIWSKEYICKFLQAKKGYLNSQARGATIKGIKIEILENLILPENSLEDQKEISLIIDRVNGIIEIRKKELKKLDEIVNARFVELFGNENNPLNWDVVNIEDVADVQVGVVIKPSQYYTDKGNGIKAFRSLNIGSGYIKNSDWVYFTEEGHEKNTKSILKENDLLIVRSGAPGTACVVTKEYEGCNAIDIIIARPNCKKVNPYYLCAYTNMPHGKRQINEGTGGAAQQHFNVGKYNKLKLVLPPIELQNEFDDFSKYVNKSKVAVQQALDKAQLLFDSLMQQYFG